MAQSLFNIVFDKCDFSILFEGHAEHALYLSTKITKLFIVMRIFYAVKFFNQSVRANTKTNTNTEGVSVRRNTVVRKMQQVLHK